jgi:hypothetical protein
MHTKCKKCKKKEKEKPIPFIPLGMNLLGWLG